MSLAFSRTESGSVSRTVITSDPFDYVVEAFQMLNVEGRIDIDSRLQGNPLHPASAWHGTSPVHWYGPVHRPTGERAFA